MTIVAIIGAVIAGAVLIVLVLAGLYSMFGDIDE